MTKLLIRQILKNPIGLDWSLQGFGMLRLYLSDEIRLHIWHYDYAVENVSTIHTHPWDFTSEIIVGRIANFRYLVSPDSTDPKLPPYRFATIKCGPGGGMRDESRMVVRLAEQYPETYLAGHCYRQTADEIHRTEAYNGTVTLVTRKFRADPDHARVFWPAQEHWVSAEPRPAKPKEVLAFTEKALSLF